MTEVVKRKLPPPQEPVSQPERLILNFSDHLVFKDVKYFKLNMLKARIELINGLSKRRVNLWLCIPDDSKFPKIPVVIPEYLS